MMFCPKCGSILTQRKDKNKTFIGCSCGYVSKSGKVEVKEEIKTKDEKIDIVDANDETLPQTDAECEKCKNNKAYFWMIQTRAGDEPETKFYKCTKCRHVWRDYS